MTINRRTFLQGTGAIAGAAAIGSPAIAQAKTKIRVGYLHTLAVDGQMWLADHLGAFDKNGLEPEFKLFQTGLEIFQAMIGGSLDVLSTGAVISNFPARGQGKMFLANAVEFATAQLWVREDQGIKIVRRPQGQAHRHHGRHHGARVPEQRRMKANNLAATDIELLNQRMPDAVTSFISGAVPAVALWVPFNITVRDKVPGARKLVDASAYYPQAAIMSGLGHHGRLPRQEPRGAGASGQGLGRRQRVPHGQDRRSARGPAEEAVSAGAARRLQGAVRRRRRRFRPPSGASSTATAR